MPRYLTLLLVPLLLLAAPSPASAATGDLGHDVSYPQCGDPAVAAAGAFGIVGVNNGLPWSENPCLTTQALWAASSGEWELYVNTANPGTGSQHWPTAGTGFCATGALDAGCAYEYGRAAAADSVSRAVIALDGTGLNPLAVPWWLDVEGSRTPGQPGNSWVGSGVVNAADLQGFVDGLRQAGVPEVGVYSTSYQWNDISGSGYTRATSPTYRSQWPAWMARYPLEDGPVWFAGVGAQSDAQTRCISTSFTGGQRLLAQYADGTYDGDYRCADPDRVAPTASITSPASRVTQTSTVRVSWTGADTGGSGLASYDVRTTRAASNGGFGAWSYPTSTQRALSTYAYLSSPPLGYTACYASRSRDAAGNISAWSALRCTAVPLDDRALSASSGWTRSIGTTGSSWFKGTSTDTTRYGATLTKTGLQTRRLHLIAMRCSTCGKVGVYVGSSLLATVNLYATSSSRVIFTLPTFSLRTTTVTLKVLTSGKTVRIDGLATSRS